MGLRPQRTQRSQRDLDFEGDMKTSQTIEQATEGCSDGYPMERVGVEDCAMLSSDGRYTSFSYGGNTIRFLTSPRLLRYEKVLKWDNGYLEVIANYNGKEEEEYIDLVPILENLQMDVSAFLVPIERVEVSYGD